MTDITVLQQEVRDWSIQNFGDQKGIGHLAPFMGIMEECGELTEAVLDEDETEVWDAVGDIGIYSLDCSARAKILVDYIWPTKAPVGLPFSASRLMILSGRVAHVFLKTHQGIRGFDDPNFAIPLQIKALRELLEEVNNCFDLTGATHDTWNSIVKKRNWTKDNAAE